MSFIALIYDSNERPDFRSDIGVIDTVDWGDKVTFSLFAFFDVYIDPAVRSRVVWECPVGKFPTEPSRVRNIPITLLISNE